MFRAPKILKESLNATKTVTVRAATGMKNKANLRHCRTPGDAGGGGADRGRRALSAEPAGRAVTLRSAGWAWRLLTRAEAGRPVWGLCRLRLLCKPELSPGTAFPWKTSQLLQRGFLTCISEHVHHGVIHEKNLGTT